MTRGTTPKLTFSLPFDASQLSRLSIAFAQRDTVVLQKDLEDCQVEGREVSVQMTEDDTLAFLPDESVVYIQVRCGIGERRMASDIICASVGKILTEGKL